MTREQVWKTVAESLRPGFGRLLDVRDVRRVRRVVGDAWVVTIVLAAPGGDMHVADVTVDDAGTMTPVLNADHVIEAARRAEKFTLGASSSESSQMPDELADFGDAGGAGEEDDELAMLEELDAPIETRIEQALAKGDPESLRIARELLPRLLADHDRQGATLFKMAEVEVMLGENALARGYLEAAAREFADRFDLPNLEAAAALGLQLVGKEAFTGSAVHTLLEQSRARLRPLDSVFLARSFTELPDYVRDRIIKNLSLRTLAPGEALVNEGEPSQNVFVVKSGLLGVWLEKPSGGSYLVRCCFPGWLLGESSVLDKDNPRCTATLRAERISEIWTIPGPVIRAAMEDDLPFGIKIAQTKQMHRIDSFFSMHETMGQLDVQVRDEMLSCIQRLETFDAHTTILKANEVPNVACLVARGSLAIYEDGKPNTPIGVIEPDSFYGVRDAIHRIAPSVSAVSSPGTTIAFFDAVRLQQLCERSPEQVAAVLERLG